MLLTSDWGRLQACFLYNHRIEGGFSARLFRTQTRSTMFRKRCVECRHRSRRLNRVGMNWGMSVSDPMHDRSNSRHGFPLRLYRSLISRKRCQPGILSASSKSSPLFWFFCHEISVCSRGEMQTVPTPRLLLSSISISSANTMTMEAFVLARGSREACRAENQIWSPELVPMSANSFRFSDYNPEAEPKDNVGDLSHWMTHCSAIDITSQYLVFRDVLLSCSPCVQMIPFQVKYVDGRLIGNIIFLHRAMMTLSRLRRVTISPPEP